MLRQRRQEEWRREGTSLYSWIQETVLRWNGRSFYNRHQKLTFFVVLIAITDCHTTVQYSLIEHLARLLQCTRRLATEILPAKVMENLTASIAIGQDDIYVNLFLLFGCYLNLQKQHVGGERNRKQRIPVNSITSKLVLKSIYASGSTGPFFADHYLNI